MKTRQILIYAFIACISITTTISCKDKESEISYFHKVDPAVSVYVTFPNSEQQFTTSQKRPFGNEIKIDFPYYYPENSETRIDVSQLKLFIEFHKEITVSTVVPEIINLDNPLVIDYVNADGTKEILTITANISKNGDARITYFALPQVEEYGLIVESVKKIGINKKGKDLSNQVPEIRISESATISPDPSIPQNFNNPVEYTVTAQDGTEIKYVVDNIDLLDNFDMTRGINIASWLSTPKYSGAQRIGFFQEADVKLLSEAGFDHIRLCVDEVVMWDDAGRKIYPYAFDLLHNAVEWCSKHNMRVLVDLHTTRNHRFTNSENILFTDPNEPPKFIKLWEDLSDELSKYPNSLVAYELLNEPVSGDPENWNKVAALAINAIRAKEKNRTIIVGVCTSNSAERYNDLKLPSTHKILMTFHYYGPFLLTYYGAQSTTGGRRDIPIQYPGQLVPDEWISALPVNWQSTGRRIYTKETHATNILQRVNKAKQLGVSVFVGEFGTWNATPEPARTNWYRDIVAILSENEIPYTSWDYKGAGYSVISDSREILYPEIFKILSGK